MNSTEQRTHRTVTQSLEQRIADLEVIVDTLSTNNGVLAAMCETLHHRVVQLEILQVEAKQDDIQVPSGLLL